MTIQQQIRVHIDLFLLFAQDFSTKIYDRLSIIISMCTTIRPKIRVLINAFFICTRPFDQS